MMIRLLFITALGHLARKHGMSEIAEHLGISRQRLYQSFHSKHSPRWERIIKIMRLLNVDLFAIGSEQKPKRAH